MTGNQNRSQTLSGIHSKSEEILNVRGEISRDQGRAAAVVDRVGHGLARPILFFSALATVFAWVVLNVRGFPLTEPWDPYPFTFLATVASAVAPFLTLLVLMYQRRNSRIAEVRQELDLQVALYLERQSSMILRLLDTRSGQGGTLSSDDRALLEELKAELDAKRLMSNVRRELEETSE